MSGWGNIVWGDGSLWGATPGDNLVWGVEVDWDGDGAFDGSNEAERLIGVQTFRGRQSYLSTGDGFSSIQTGSAQITLENDDGRYDPWNTESPLYPNVIDGRVMRLRVLNVATGVLSNMFYGVITDIQASNYQDKPAVILQIEDGWRNLRRVSARVALQENIRPDLAIGLILDAAKWSWGRNLDVTSDSIQYFWSSGNILAGTELERLAQSFLANFFIDAGGNARLISRLDIADAVAYLPEDELSKDLVLAQPWENRRTVTRIKTHPLSLAASVTLWSQTGNAPAIASGTPLVLWANYTYNGKQVSAKNVITPVVTTDWTANANSDGSGADRTGSVTLAFSNLGDTAKLIFTYNGGGTVYLTTAKIRGDALYELGVTDVTYPADTSTVTDPREFILDMPWQQDINVAMDFLRVIGPFLARTNPFPQVKLEGRPDVQFVPDLFDIGTVSIPRIGIDGIPMRVAGIGHQAAGNCQTVVTTFYLEPYVASGSFWTWPIVDFGVDTIFGW